jgi:hypothetical protein
MCCPGDLNKDGVPDIVIGDPAWELDSASKIVAYSGKDGALLWSCTGTSASEGLGFALWPMNDGNGDGIPDVLASWHMFATGGVRLLSGRDGTTLLQSRSPEGSPMPTLGWRVDGGILGAADKSDNVIVSQFDVERGMSDQAVVVLSRADLREKHRFAMPALTSSDIGGKK